MELHQNQAHPTVRHHQAVSEVDLEEDRLSVVHLVQATLLHQAATGPQLLHLLVMVLQRHLPQVMALLPLEVASAVRLEVVPLALAIPLPQAATELQLPHLLATVLHLLEEDSEVPEDIAQVDLEVLVEDIAPAGLMEATAPEDLAEDIALEDLAADIVLVDLAADTALVDPAADTALAGLTGAIALGDLAADTALVGQAAATALVAQAADIVLEDPVSVREEVLVVPAGVIALAVVVADKVTPATGATHTKSL